MSSSSSSFLTTWNQLYEDLENHTTNAEKLTEINESVDQLLSEIRQYIYKNNNILDVISNATRAKTLNYDLTDLYQYSFYKNIGILISLCCSFLIIKNYHNINDFNFNRLSSTV